MEDAERSSIDGSKSSTNEPPTTDLSNERSKSAEQQKCFAGNHFDDSYHDYNNFRDQGVLLYRFLLQPGSVAYLSAAVIIALLLSYFHFHYIYRLFEHDKHFSHLSTLERELSFRTEMGLYYSYFKEIALDSPSFTQGFLAVISDNRTEAPTTINVLERFNLYPEVFLSAIYRWMNARGMLTEVCYRVDRGENMSPVRSCEGHKEPTYFYVTCVFILNGCLLGTLFLFGTYLSKSILGGLLTALAYMFNHGEATRVMWYVRRMRGRQRPTC